MKIKKRIISYLNFFIFRVRIFTRSKAREIADSVKVGEKILEIGSGWPDKNGYYYFSSKKYFVDKQVDFIMSDFNPSAGVRFIDAAFFDEPGRYDHILCFHVLDDVYDWQAAFINLFNALRTGGGNLHIILPVFCGFDAPDYYRFSEKLIREFCQKNNFEIVQFGYNGFKNFPFTMYFRIKK